MKMTAYIGFRSFSAELQKIAFQGKKQEEPNTLYGAGKALPLLMPAGVMGQAGLSYSLGRDPDAGMLPYTPLPEKVKNPSVQRTNFAEMISEIMSKELGETTADDGRGRAARPTDAEDRDLYKNLIKQKDTARGSRAQILSPGRKVNLKPGKLDVLFGEKDATHRASGTGNAKALDGHAYKNLVDPAHDVRKGFVWGNRNPYLTAHELGHHQISSTRAGRAIQSRFMRTMSDMAGGHLGLIGSAAAGATSDNYSGAAIRGAAVPAVMSAPVLAYEALASINGLRKLRAAGANARQMSAAKKVLGKAWGTYGTAASISVGGGALAGTFGQAIRQEMNDA